MNDLHQMMPHSQIFQNNQNNAVWPHPPQPYLPENAAVFARPPVLNSHPGRVNRSKKKVFYRAGSGRTHPHKPCNPSPVYFQLPPASRSGAKGRRFQHPKQKIGIGAERPTPPFAPRNTTSFLIHARKSGGIAPLISPLRTPAAPPSQANFPPASLSPSTFDEEAAKKQWGFNGYGSMDGLIRIRPRKCGSGEDSVADRFEIVYPGSGEEHNLDKRVDEQDSQIAHLEEENLTLKERLFVMERQLSELRRRIMCLETDGTTSRDGEGEAENFPAGDVCSVKNITSDDGDHHNDMDGV